MRKDPFAPENESSTGLLLAIILLSVLAISTYLMVGGSIANSAASGTKVYVPESATIGDRGSD